MHCVLDNLTLRAMVPDDKEFLSHIATVRDKMRQGMYQGKTLTMELGIATENWSSLSLNDFHAAVCVISVFLIFFLWSKKKSL